MPFNRAFFFDTVRESLFGGSLTQRQVDGMSYLLDVWEEEFEDTAEELSVPWLAYCLATVFHETGTAMTPVEEYGRGQGMSYGTPVGPYEQTYYGRGHVQLTWEENYKKAEGILHDYGRDAPTHRYPHRMLEDETSAIVLFDGMKEGWFTGVGLPDFFNADEEDPYNARKIVNGLDQADKIVGYYWEFKKALQEL
jgi:putative chitinase